MQQFATFLIIRFCLAFFSSSVLALLAQIAVFRYTRFENAPIPAGEIIGPSAGTFSVVIGTLWFVTVAIFMLVGGSKFSFSLLSVSSISRPSVLTEYLSSIRSSVKWGMIPTIAAVVISVIAIINEQLTARTLNYLGYGGGMFVCYIDTDSVDSSVTNWIGTSFSANGEGLVSSERDAARIMLTGVVRGRLIYSSKNVAYLKFVTPNFGRLYGTEIVQTSEKILALLDGPMEPIPPIDPDAIEYESSELVPHFQREQITRMLAVDMGEFLLSGYHQVPISRISANC